MSRRPDALVLKRPWLRTKHWVMLAVFSMVDLVVAYFWSTTEPNGWLIAGTLIALSWNYNLVAMFVNATAVSVDQHGISVTHGPLPSPFGLKRSARRADVKQLFAVKHGALYAVRAQLHSSAEPLTLVAPLASAHQAWFIEQQLEAALGIVDVAVEGELAREPVQLAGPAQRGALSGALAALAVPGLVAGGIGLFAFAAHTEVSGTLTTKGDDPWTFAGDDCVSGQREGFGGVTISSGAARGQLLRVVADPVKGHVLVAVRPGQPNRVFDGAGCARFDVRVDRTNTSINDIWAVDGSVSIDCPSVSGQLVFSGCH